MRCACPWCTQLAQAGCVSLFTGAPTCAYHDYRAVAADLAAMVRVVVQESEQSEQRPVVPHGRN